MSQANLTVNNGDGAAVRTGFNAAIGAVASCSTGPTQPPEIVPGMLWLDTSVTPALLKRRNAADTAWLLTQEAMPNIGGTANAITLALGAGGASISDGYVLTFIPTVTNTGDVTINGAPALTVTGAAMPAGYLLDGAITKATWDGSSWRVALAEVVPSYRFVQELRITSNTSFVKADYPWLRAIRVRVQGGGAGGTGTSTATRSVGGGGGGGYAESFITDISGLAASVSVTVGSGGAGGTATAATVAGGDGGASSFGSLVVGEGGGTAGGASGGDGGGGTGDLVIPGSGGGGGSGTNSDVSISGHGGGSHLGGGAGGFGDATTAIAGRDGRGYGGGGGGGRNGAAGGNGAPGIVILELFA